MTNHPFSSLARLTAAVLLLSVTCISGAAAQSPALERWTVEVHAGRAVGSSPAGGTGSLPAPNAAFTPLAGGPPSRTVPSWAFGDGTVLFNQVATNTNVAQLITPLDATLMRRIATQQAGVSVGGRMTRWLSPRWNLEFSADFNSRRSVLAGAVRPGVEATRASYAPAFNALLLGSQGTISNPVSVATATFADHSGSEVMGTAALEMKFGADSWQPYVSFGGGVLGGHGRNPSFTLTGDYQFTVNGLPIHESDVVTVRQHVGLAPVGLIGGGVTKDVTSHVGIRLDGRVLFAGNPTETQVIATGSSLSNGNVSVVYPFNGPLALSFSSRPGIPSSLAGGSATTFKGNGMRVLGLVTFSVFVRL